MASGQCLCGAFRFIADISIGYAFVLAAFTKLECELSGHVSAYRDRLQARPAFVRATAK